MTGQTKRSVQPIPKGFHTVTTYLTVPNIRAVIEFVKKAFNGEVRFQMEGPAGTVAHAEVAIGDSIVMMGEPAPDSTFPPRPCNIYLYVPDVDTTYRRAMEAGGQSVRPLADQFYGDRSGAVADPGGNVWWIATHIEDVSPDELERRMKALKPGQC